MSGHIRLGRLVRAQRKLELLDTLELAVCRAELASANADGEHLIRSIAEDAGSAAVHAGLATNALSRSKGRCDAALARVAEREKALRACSALLTRLSGEYAAARSKAEREREGRELAEVVEAMLARQPDRPVQD